MIRKVAKISRGGGKVAIMIAATFAGALGADAGTFNWTGAGGDAKWSNPDNWSEAAAPAEATDVAAFDIATDATTEFDLSVSPVIEKRGDGRLTLSGGSAYDNTVSTGSVFLYGGSLDLGGGKASIYQPEDAENENSPSWSGGTALYNGTFAYTSAHKVQADANKSDSSSIYWREGTLTLGSGAELSHTGQFFEYGPSAPAAKYGARRFFIDGGTLNMTGRDTHRYVIGVNGTHEKGAILEVANGGKYYDNAGKTLIIGARNSGVGSASGAKGVFVVRDGAEAYINGAIMLANDLAAAGTYARISLTNATLTVAGNINISGMDNSSKSDVAVEVNASTFSFKTLTTKARAGTGIAAGLQTGIIILDNGGTLRALQNSTASAAFMKNDNNAANDTLCILSGGGAIDTQNYNVSLDVVAYGEGALTKKGSGTLTVTRANKFSGVLDAKEGSVILSGSIAGGVAVSGGNFTTATSGTYPSLLMDGGTAKFTGNEPCTFEKVEIGESGGTLELSVKGFAFNNVSGTDNLSALTLSAVPSGWGTGDVLYSDSPAFLEWAAGQLNTLLADGFSASVSGSSVAIDSAAELKTTIWTGGGSDASWATAENWEAGAPGTADTVILDGTAKTATELDSTLAPASVSFAETAGAFTVSGTGSLAVSGGVTNFSSNAQTFNVPVTLSGANGIVHSDGDIAFAGGLSAASLVKDGAGTMTLSQSYTGLLDIQDGGVVLDQPEDGDAIVLTETADALKIGGTLDLGGGSLTLNQSETGDPILRDGATLKHGTFAYANTGLVYSGGASPDASAIRWENGTVTVGEGATLTHSGIVFAFGASAPASNYGARRLFVDGGTVNITSPKGVYVIGVNNDFEKDAVLEIANGGRFSYPNNNGVVIGAKSSSSSSNKAKGSIIVRDGGTFTTGSKITLVNPRDASSGHIAITNGTLTTTHGDGLAIFGWPWTQQASSQCDAAVEIDGGTLEVNRLAIVAMAGTGAMAGKSTGTVHLNNGGTIKARANDGTYAFCFNGASDTTYPALELMSGGGIIDSNGKNITASAVIYGEGGLTKKGAGTLTLSGANTYEGGTVVEAGTLAVTGAISGDLTVKAGAEFSCPAGSTFGAVTIEKGATIGVPDTFDGEWAPILTATGGIELHDTNAANGNRLFVRETSSGSVLCWGKSPGFMVILY